MKSLRFLCAAALIAAVAPAPALSQALTSLSSLRVGYNTRKATLQPEGALKTQIDEVDQEIAAATRAGRTGDVRRLIAKGQALLAGREWSDSLDFSNSLVVRTDRLVVDSDRPYLVRLEQIYQPEIELTQSLVARATLRNRAIAATASTPAQGGEVVKELGTYDGVARDLRESPHFMELNLSGVPDGTYALTIDVAEGARGIGTAALTINVRKGVEGLAERLTAAAASAPEHLRADILYPVDRMRVVNRGLLELRTFNPDRDFAAAEAVAAAVSSGSDPFAGRTGDFKRAYLLESAGEIMPYRVYVPRNYDPAREYPLVIALHGLGGTEDNFFDNYEGNFPRLAEERGYIIAAPLGYRVDGFYGWGVGNPPSDPNTRRLQERSEEDVMQVLGRMREQYNVDDSRIYLIGHSMGAIGTWRMAPKYPDIWAALGTFAGSGAPATLERIRHIPNFVVHGDADATVGVEGSRTMVARMKELGMGVQYTEVPGGSHSGVVAPYADEMFDFLDAHRKK